MPGIFKREKTPSKQGLEGAMHINGLGADPPAVIGARAGTRRVQVIETFSIRKLTGIPTQNGNQAGNGDFGHSAADGGSRAIGLYGRTIGVVNNHVVLDGMANAVHERHRNRLRSKVEA